MEEIQEKLDRGELNLNQVKSEIKKRIHSNYEVSDNSRKIIKLSVIGDRWGEPFSTIIIMTYDGYIVSQDIEGVKITDFDIEKDDIKILKEENCIYSLQAY